MNRDKYDQDIERCGQIGHLLGYELGSKFESRKQLAELFSQVSGLSYSTAWEYVHVYVSRGPSPQKISSGLIGNPMHNQAKTEKNLERLAIFYQMIGIDADHEVVKLTKEVNPAFSYPLQRTEQVSCLVEIKFGDETVNVNYHEFRLRAQLVASRVGSLG